MSNVGLPLQGANKISGSVVEHGPDAFLAINSLYERLFTFKPFADRRHGLSAAGQYSNSVFGNDYFISAYSAFVFLSDSRH